MVNCSTEKSCFCYSKDMAIGQYILVYFLTLIAFLGIDGVWLGLIARNMYKNGIGHLMAATPQWLPAIIFYALYVAGVLILVVFPAIEKESFGRALLFGAILGCLAYATYDLTNAATLKGWPISITIIDIVWGTILTAIVAGIGFQIVQWIR